MARLGRLRIVLRTAAGVASSGVTVTVRKQGAYTVGVQSGSPLTVDAVNAIIAGDDVAVNTGATTRNVSAITATTVSCGLGFSTVDDDRLTPTGNLPSLYVDEAGAEALSNPGTTNAAGTFECHLLGGLYDVLVSGGGVTTQLYTNVGTEGAENVRSNVYSGTAYNFDTLRALAASDIAFQVSSGGVSEFIVRGDGEIVAGQAGATHALTGDLSVTGTLDIASTSSLGGTVTQTAGNYAQTGVASSLTQTGSLGGNTLSQPTTCTGNLTVSGAGKTLTVSADSGIVCSGGKIRASGGAIQHKAIASFADLDATPSVLNGNFFLEANSGATSITNLDDGPNSTNYTQLVTIRFTTANTTIVHGAGTIRLAGGANFVGTAADTLTLMSDTSTPTIWYEIGRSVNG